MPDQNNHSIFDVMKNYNHLLTPVINAIVGLTAFGPYGATAGVVAGITDENFLDRPHFSASFLAGCISQSFAKEKTINLNYFTFGSSMGLGLSYGIIQDYPVIIKIAENALAFYQLYSLPGAVFGAIAAIIDEAVAYNFPGTHINLSAGVKAATFSHLALPLIGAQIDFFSQRNDYSKAGLKLIKPYFTCISLTAYDAVISAYATLYTTPPMPAELPVLKLINKLYSAFDLVLEKVDYDYIVSHQIIHSAGLNFVVHTLEKKRQENAQNIFSIYKNSEAGKISVLYEYAEAGIRYLIIVYAKDIASYFENVARISYINILGSKMEINTKIELHSNGTKAALFANNQTNAGEYISRLNADILVLSKEGLTLVSSSISTYTEGMISLATIINGKAFDIATIVFAFNLLSEKISIYISELAIEPKAKISSLTPSLHKRTFSGQENSMEIELLKGANYEAEIINPLSIEIKSLYSVVDIYSALSTSWQSQKTAIEDRILDMLILFSIIKYQWEKDNSIPVWYGIKNLMKVTSWTGNNAQAITNIDLSYDAFNKLIGMMRNQDLNHETISRIHSNESHSLVISDLTMKNKITQEEFLSLRHFEFESGKIYGITGKSGCGKSSLLVKIAGIDSGTVSANGTMIYPENSSISFITQKNYIPEGRLLDIILYPMKADDINTNREQLKERIIRLIEKLQIWQNPNINLYSKLEEVADWAQELSGGQQKKIAIIRALMKHTTILIIDEAFAGLDHSAIENAQRVIKETRDEIEFPITIIVDHQAIPNNTESFYDVVIDLCGENADII